MLNNIINLMILYKNKRFALALLFLGISIITAEVLLKKMHVHIPHLASELAIRIAESFIIIGTFKVIEFLKANKNYGYLDLYGSIASDNRGEN